MPELKKPFGMLIRLQDAIDFDAIDGKPVDIVFLLLLPASSQDGPLNVLAGVARKLRDPECVQQLRRAADSGKVYNAWACEGGAVATLTGRREFGRRADEEGVSPS